MTRSIACAALISIVFAAIAGVAIAKPPPIPGIAAQLASYHPLPEYPREAARRHISGSGSIRLFVEISSGTVVKAEVAQSTGNAMLDAAGLQTFRTWRFKAEALRAVISKYAPKDRDPLCTVLIPLIFAG